MKRIALLPIVLVLFATFGNAQDLSRKTQLINYVDPFIGTDFMGHCYPGATAPFGMVQLSPDTDSIWYSNGKGYNRDVYKYCAGYQYSDPTIVGFSHTHFHGTGHSDLGDFLIMPTVGEIQLNPGTADQPESGYRSRFSHEKEEASPGYYAVTLEDYDIDAELTATSRVGFHKYTFPKSDEAHIILDLLHGIYNYDEKVVWSYIRVENDTLVTGYRQTRGWARTRYIYFAMSFSKPIASYGYQNKEKIPYGGFWRKFDQTKNFPEMAGRKLKAYFNFETDEREDIKIKFALSPVSMAGAMKNLAAEIPHWDFDQVRQETALAWEKELSKIKVSGTEDQLTNFYTAMYHSFLSPVEYSDVDGSYRGLDQNNHKAENFTNYTIFSLWDTYRALHPLLTILQPKRTNDMIQSMLAHYDQSVHKLLPVWSHHANDNWCMIGYHAVPVIIDAYNKGIRDYDISKAFEAVKSSANYDKYDGIGDYKKYGYVPADKHGDAASKTLEYGYDDWTIYSFAKGLGKMKDVEVFKERAKSYERLFDPETRFIRAKKSNGEFTTPFNPLSTHGQGYIEGNAWNYSLYVPHDVANYIKISGGEDYFCKRLDSLFSIQLSDEDIAGSEDIEKVGIIGNYVHGNEPSHHIPYLYSYAGKAWKTQERIHQIMNSMYKNSPGGLCGNDDCGQMSAWYIFSAMGFYPVCPGSNEYIIGSPYFKEACIKLGNNTELKIVAPKLSEKNIYIKSIEFNGKKWNKTYFTHQDLLQGGEIIFHMSSRPNKKFWEKQAIRPYSLSKEQ